MKCYLKAQAFTVEDPFKAINSAKMDLSPGLTLLLYVQEVVTHSKLLHKMGHYFLDTQVAGI